LSPPFSGIEVSIMKKASIWKLFCVTVCLLEVDRDTERFLCQCGLSGLCEATVYEAASGCSNVQDGVTGECNGFCNGAVGADISVTVVAHFDIHDRIKNFGGLVSGEDVGHDIALMLAGWCVYFNWKIISGQAFLRLFSSGILIDNS